MKKKILLAVFLTMSFGISQSSANTTTNNIETIVSSVLNGLSSAFKFTTKNLDSNSKLLASAAALTASISIFNNLSEKNTDYYESYYKNKYNNYEKFLLKHPKVLTLFSYIAANKLTELSIKVISFLAKSFPTEIKIYYDEICFA